MALNLVRNSKVFFTTNVNANTGVINSSGFTASNTYEIQVLDGFTFSQNTNQETVTVSEAGTTPVRGQRSFNTSLAPVDFSMSTYLRPALVSSAVTAEESVLWNALFSSQSIDTSPVALGGTPTATYAYASGVGTLTLGSISISSGQPAVGDYVIITGLSQGTYDKWLNAAAKVTGRTGTGPYTAMTLEYVNPYPGTINSITASATTTKIWDGAGWAQNGSTNAIATVASSNKNQLQKFGMLFLVDQVLYAVDNATLTQVSIDFGIDAIATGQWTGQATTLRKLADGATFSAGTISSLTESLGGATVSAQAGSGSAFTATVTLTTAIASSLTVGNTITATGTPGVVGSNATVTSITRDNTGKLTSFTIATTTANTNGLLATVTATILNSGNYTQKNVNAAYLTNKISTVTLSVLNALTSADGSTIAPNGTAYTLALTGGSLTISNNVTYITPANLGVVNLPVASFTGTRAISGTMNAYLKTGVGAGDTGQLLADLLAAASITTEPMFTLTMSIGGTGSNRVELDMPSTVLSIPTVDVQQVVSTSVNFTAQGSKPTGSTSSVYDIEKLNDIQVRYYAA